MPQNWNFSKSKFGHKIIWKMESLMMTKHWPNCQQYLSKIIPKGKCYFHIKNYHFSFLLAFWAQRNLFFTQPSPPLSSPFSCQSHVQNSSTYKDICIHICIKMMPWGNFKITPWINVTLLFPCAFIFYSKNCSVWQSGKQRVEIMSKSFLKIFYAWIFHIN